MFVTGFNLQCSSCGHKNRPARSFSEGIRLVLAGSFTRCRSCGSEFTKIRIPNRPLVEELLEDLDVSPLVEIFPYNGKPPVAIGESSR